MKVSILSDLHCRSSGLPALLNLSELEPADVLVLAGDTGVVSNQEKSREKIVKATEGKFKQLVFVNGNHDYYQSLPSPEFAPKVEDNFVLHLQENKDDGSYRNIDFICSTMWSPISEAGRAIIPYCLSVYLHIYGFTTDRCNDLFQQNVAWLEETVTDSRNAGHDIVIVTHHLPRRELIDAKYAKSEINEAFCVLNDEAEKRLNALKPMLWIHGHSHNFMDVTIDGTRYIRNPYGYERLFCKEETGFRKNFIVEI